MYHASWRGASGSSGASLFASPHTPPPSASTSAAAAAATAVNAVRHKSNAKATRPHNVPPAELPLIGNMIVERLPFVIPPPPQWEMEYQTWSHERAMKFRKEMPEELVNPKTDFEDTESEHETFVEAPRETEADKSGDVRTMHRRMDEFLFLVVQERSTGEWGFPKRVHAEGETMREVAKKAMDECVGDSIETFLVGNAPLGHFLESKAGGAPAAKGGGGGGGGGGEGGGGGKPAGGGGKGTNFYHRAQWLDGELQLQDKYKDFKWLTKVRDEWICATHSTRALYTGTRLS